MQCPARIAQAQAQQPRPARRSQRVKVAFIAAGSAACHSIIGDINGLCYTWGRNEVRLGRPACPLRSGP